MLNRSRYFLMSTTIAPAASMPFPVRLFSVEEYHRLGEAGILTEDDAVELLEGWISPKMIRTPQHDAVVALVEQALRARLPANWTIRVQSAITTAASEPAPDLAIVRGTPRDYLRRHPSGADAALIVEVADSSLDRDRVKAGIYAAAAVQGYWIVNLVDDCVEVYSQPMIRRRQYAKKMTRHRDDELTLAIAGAPDATLPVNELLP